MTAQQSEPKKRFRPPKALKEKLQQMLSAGMTEREICKALDKPKSTVHYAIQKEFTADQLAIFRNQEAEDIDEKRKIILQELTREEIKDACPKDKVWMYGVLFDKSQVIRGKPTSITDYRLASIEINQTLNQINQTINVYEGSADEPIPIECKTVDNLPDNTVDNSDNNNNNNLR